MPVAEPESEPEPLAAEEVERLIALAEQGQLEAADQQRIAPLLRTLLWLEHALLETRITLATLKRLLFGKATEKTPRKPADDPPDAPADAPSDGRADGASTTEPPSDTQDERAADGETASETDTPTPSTHEQPDTPRAPGHGRLGASDYPGAEVQRCDHNHLGPGDLCPAGRAATGAPSDLYLGAAL